MRVAVQALAAVLGGTQSLHTNGYDEALGLPTEEAARIALRTQQIIGYETGVVDTPDPLAGSYFVESLTDEVERLAWEYIERIDEMGGAVAAIEAGYQMDEIEQAAYEYTKSIDDGERVIVGVNRFTSRTRPSPTCSRSTRRSRPARSSGSGASRPTGTSAGAGPPPRRRSRRRRGTAQPAPADEGGALRPTPPSARSATPSATCSASTTPAARRGWYPRA